MVSSQELRRMGSAAQRDHRRTVGWAAAAGAAAILAMSGASPLRAQQTGTVVGEVVDRRTLAPLSGAQVVVAQTSMETFTDARGRFQLQGLSGQEVTLRVTLLGYRTATQTAAIGATNVRIALEETAIELDQIVVTGTAGATQKRAIGNAVAQVNAAQVVQIAPVADVSQLLNARSPGVVLRPPSGLAGAGARILIRGRNSIALSGDPLIYVDGVRVDNRGPTGGSGIASASRLNDFSPEDIERIEIVKGPAATTLYGTEAASGVIQIITKRGRSGPPVLSASLRQGAAWFMDPEGRWPVSYLREPDGQVVEFNLARVEAEAGRPLFRTGRLQGYALNVSGGSDALRYYIGSDFDRDEGALPTNKAERYGARVNLDLAPSGTFSMNSQIGIVASRVDYGPSGSLMFAAVLSRPANRNTPARGFFNAPAEVWNRAQNVEQDVNRITAGIEFRHQPLGWLNHRLRTGLDLTDEQNITLFRRLTPEDARFFAAGTAAGSKTVNEDNILTMTVDYIATAALPLTEGLTSNTSGGLQYYRSNRRILRAEGREFPSTGVVSIAGAAQRFGFEDQEENVTVGVFVQEQIGWRDRFFVTAAVRADDNSAFGEEFDLVYYPKVSASWVVSEEPFWNLSPVAELRLRAAYGESGQQPTAFAALRTFEPITGQAGQPAITPQFVGNPLLGPERGKEIELGFEAGLFGQRLGIDFTYYAQRTEDAIVLRDVAPSSGFYRQQFVNLAEVRNRGIELLATLRPVQARRVSWEVTGNIATNDNEVVELGLEGTEFLEFGINRNRHQPGYPINAFFSRRVVSAERAADGRPINILCDDGMGGGVACTTAPRVYAGRPEPNLEGSFSSTLTLFNRLSLFGLVDFKRGHRTWSSTLWCPGILGCEDEVYPERFDPVFAASSVIGLTDDARWVMDMSFVKLREVALSYTLPDHLVRRFGASRASIAVAGRNLHTWTDFPGLDPENMTTFGLSGGTFEQNELPQVAQFVTKINLTF